MQLPTYFRDFLGEIRPTANHREDCKNGHRVLRKRLLADEVLGPCIVSIFLQGSYRRATAIRPHQGKRSDVDLIVVTKLDRDEFTPQEVVEVFLPFVDTWYPDKYEVHDRSIGIELSYVDLDLVVTSAPSESQVGILTSEAVAGDETPEDEDAQDWRLNESWVSPADRAGRWDAPFLLQKSQREAPWKTEPLYIPSRDLACWVPTDPLAQIQWTWDKNRTSNTHYVNVVKALKWWRRLNPEPVYPKGYPLEHLVGACCPDSISSVAEGVVLSLENIRDRYSSYAALKVVPYLKDHGVAQNVLGRVSGEDFAGFHALVTEAARIAREAYDADTVQASANRWRDLLGDKFPKPPPSDDDDRGTGPTSGGFTPRSERSVLTGGRFG